ncbi:MAG: amidohydrolase family protein, partial [Saccharopolyspora rectivirgula]
MQAWVAELGLPGLVDIHTHFLPARVMRKVWAYFDRSEEHYGMPWPVRYRHAERTRVQILRDLGVVAFAPLVYPHKPGMAEWLNGWIAEFAAGVPEAVPTATIFPEPGVARYLEEALSNGARCVKVHVQVGAFDPRDEQLREAWGLLA